MAYQPTPNQFTDSSFFDEAIDTSPISIEVGLGFLEHPHYITTSAQPMEPESLRDGGAQQNILPTVEGDKKAAHRTRNRRQSQASSALSGTSASGLVTESPKPRKRSRKPKKQSKESDTTGQQGDLDDDDLPKGPRRRRILEHNRNAATKYRLRKTDEASALASREQALEDQNRSLSTCFDALTTEIYHLKTQLLQHTDCNCVLIQKYIANEARKSAEGLLACSSSFNAYSGSLSPDYGGSNDANTTDSFNNQCPEAGSISLTWTNPFQQRPRAPEVRDGMFDMSLEPFQNAPMPPDSMISAQTSPAVPLAGCEPGLYISAGPQQQPAGETVLGHPLEISMILDTLY
ncbi:hypothetical protein FOVG_17821 [Fusarium oxysporum f. sp. pisi HDV247]|uniref:BZIP domain-containing protein n=2 Tax=Fusarium oxysporum TaxID=5507 RepID=W9NDP2_FUSOX|nr:hypothetical protein FOVG_17821 [Fusarium oxysporum f. sp. pisi HDV247]